MRLLHAADGRLRDAHPACKLDLGELSGLAERGIVGEAVDTVHPVSVMELQRGEPDSFGAGPKKTRAQKTTSDAGNGKMVA